MWCDHLLSSSSFICWWLNCFHLEQQAETQIKRRIGIGNHISERRLIDELSRMGMNESIVSWPLKMQCRHSTYFFKWFFCQYKLHLAGEKSSYNYAPERWSGIQAGKACNIPEGLSHQFFDPSGGHAKTSLVEMAISYVQLSKTNFFYDYDWLLLSATEGGY